MSDEQREEEANVGTGEADAVEVEAGDTEAAPVAAEAGELSEEASCEERLAEAEAKASEYLDGWQRERAEYANARKRLEKSRAEAYRNATIVVISRLLPILDDYQRALENAPESVVEGDWYKGIVLIQRKLLGILESENIEPIASVGEPFDPNFHEAVLKEAADGFESDMVVRELQTGYRLGDRVIRPAMVVVAE